MRGKRATGFLVPVLFCIAFSAVDGHAAGGRRRPTEGIVAERVGKGSAAEKAGIETGDILLSWEREANPPANPVGASGRFQSPFDLDELGTEQAPRGEINVRVGRGDKEFIATLTPGIWSLSARPAWPGEIQEQYARGGELQVSSDPQGGLNLWETLADKAMRKRDTVTACWLYRRAGEEYAKLRMTGKAAGAFEKARKLAEGAGDRRLLALLLGSQGYTILNQGDLGTAQHLCDEALGLWEGISRESLCAATVVNRLGYIALKRGHLDEAGQLFERACSIREKNAPRSIELAQSFNNLGTVETYRGSLDSAGRYFEKSLAITERISPGSTDVANTLNNLGGTAWQRRDMEAAEHYLRGALAILEVLAPESEGTANCLNNLALLTSERGDLAVAEEFWKRSLAIYLKRAPGGEETVSSLAGLGSLVGNRGDLAGAEELYERALAIQERINPECSDMVICLNGLGNIRKGRYDVEGAEAFYTKALAIQEKVAARSLEGAVLLNNLGNLAADRGDPAAAERYYRESLAIRREKAPDGLDVSASLLNLGLLAKQRGELEKARDLYTQSLAIRERLAPGGEKVADTLLALGELKLQQGDADGAQADLSRALAIYERIAPGSLAEAGTLNALGEVARARGEWNAVGSYFQRAVSSLETQRGRLGGGRESSERFAAHCADFFRELVGAQVRLDRRDAAFHSLERFRARSFLGMLAERDLDFSKDAPPDLLKEKRRSDFEYEKLQGKLSELSAENDVEKVAAIQKELAELRRRQQRVADAIKKASPAYSALQYPEPMDIESAKKVLGPGVLLLSYCTGKESLILFALMDQKLEVFTVPLARKELEREIRYYRGLLADPQSDTKQLRKKAESLYGSLLGPASRQIKASKSILICPDGPLHYLPFGSLRKGKKYLIEEKPVSTIVSVTAWERVQKTGGQNDQPIRLAAFGDPQYPAGAHGAAEGALRAFSRGVPIKPLPATRVEVEAICALFPDKAQKFLGASATEDAAKNVGKGFVRIHFACHGYVDERYPLDSGLVLSIPEKEAGGTESGFLQAWEILEQMRIDADLVVLSACETALGKEMGGEGLVGLTRAFQYAGARGVLASMWSVGDESTALLMEGFYGYLRTGKSSPEALRLAQVDMIHGRGWGDSKGPGKAPRDFSHPFHWAAFALNGD